MEKFKDVKGFEKMYQVSNFGNVKSFRRKNIRLLRQRKDHKGYHLVNLCKNGKMYTRKVHRLVIETFIGPCPKGLQCCHNDGNKINNHLTNLRWDSQENNVKDMKKHGQSNYLKGEKHGSAKLTLNQIKEIRSLKGKLKQIEIAKKYNIVQPHVSRILRGANWN